jgi:hypothetical protein
METRVRVTGELAQPDGRPVVHDVATGSFTAR